MTGVAVRKLFEVGVFALIAAACADPRGSPLARQSFKQVPGSGAARVWGGERRLVASDAAEFDQFGYSVSLAEDNALLGAYGDDSYRGAAYVFVQSGNALTEREKLLASDGARDDQFGWCLSLAQDRALLGAPGSDSSRGAAYVFVQSGDSWNEEQKLIASDGTQGDHLGWSVSLAQDRALVGAPVHDNSRGAAYVFVRSGDSWTEEQKLTASDGADGDQFGYSVSLAKDSALVGAPVHDNSRGAAYVFVRSGDSWTEEQKLTARDAVLDDQFGVSVSLAKDRALIGSYWNDSLRGAAYLFVRSDGSWNEEQKLTASDGAEGHRLGNAVALGQDRALIGAYAYGAVYSFVRNDSSWTEQQKLAASDGANDELFGWSVSLSGDRALVGAHYDDNLRGAAYVFSLGLADGDTCSADADCASGYCGDARCSEVSCGGCAGASGASGAAGAASNASCASDEDCGAALYCAKDQICQPRRERGEACDDREGGDCREPGCRLCESGSCTGGVCCNRDCTGAEACTAALKVSGADGTCGEARTAVKGSFCATDETCTSGHCVDGVCCDGACAGTCEACTAALKGEGEDGTCGYVAAGLNPRKSSSDPTADCAEDLGCPYAPSCDGSGSCDCVSRCETSADCAPGAKCSSTGECVSSPDNGGCGCRTGGSPAHPRTPWLVTALELLLFARRRERAATGASFASRDLDPTHRTPAVRAGSGQRRRQ